MDQKGYIISGLSLLLMVPAMVLSICLLNIFSMGNDIKEQTIQSDKIYYASQDLQRNIPLLALEVLNETGEEVKINNLPYSNSPRYIKDELQSRINKFTSNHELQSDLEIKCTINSVHPGKDPWYVEVNSTLFLSQKEFYHEEKVSNQVPITQLVDPLPFIKCGVYGDLKYTENRILYDTLLSEYLQNQGEANSSYYTNASAPLLIHKCPYESYIIHGDENTRNSCINNGFYHYSADGACYLCRLEGKAVCIHPGLEVFILVPSLNDSLPLSAISSIDHVIFSDDIYPGEYIPLKFLGFDYGLFLDSAHRSKYGIP
ncbi:hypothetical protein HYG87_06225 [Methanobacterium alkalithermotolerans]|uniref:Uncharacterized protein n=1 Tax=Methanobacterium alkalithermotolerans TaxID=2731220 RepID=A0A8T8K4A8_9EURY|nr:hypothetical protein [Methanobacterium alkalithermotolerans]QUH23386.1 hypothetical protein HYG87_06225 [Methanobacterium alkalithermotolerans]